MAICGYRCDPAGSWSFAHAGGSRRFSRGNRYAAVTLEERGFATLLLDLLTREEEVLDVRTTKLRFDIVRLGQRVSNVS